MKPLTILSIASPALLSGCITAPHRPTPGWQCEASGLGGFVSGTADVAQDGSLILAIWSWRSPSNHDGIGMVAYSGKGNARSLDADTTAAVHYAADYGTGPVALAHQAGEVGWQNPIPVGDHDAMPYRVTIDWNTFVRLAKGEAPLYALRRDGKGSVISRELSKSDILTGSHALTDVRTELAAKVADPAIHCVAVDDLYPEIIVT